MNRKKEMATKGTYTVQTQKSRDGVKLDPETEILRDHMMYEHGWLSDDSLPGDPDMPDYKMAQLHHSIEHDERYSHEHY